MSIATATGLFLPRHADVQHFNHKVVPNAARLVDSLRSVGYSQVDAVLDLADNSFDAGATNIRFFFNSAEGEKKRLITEIVIADDGQGMDAAQLSEAMRLGSAGPEKDRLSDLGWFGMGLWTASSSLGRRVTVLTRAEGGKLLKAVNDLQAMIDANEFVSFLGEATSEEREFFDQLVKAPTGTVVVLDNLDRLQTKSPDAFANHFRKEAGRVYRHFIAAKRTLVVNGRVVLGIDPLHWDNSGTEHYDDNPLTVEYEDDDGVTRSDTIHVKIAVLPEDLGSETDDAANMRNQGIYLCRNNREVAKAVTLGMFSRHNYLNRVRVELKFSGTLDKQMGVDISKTGIKPTQSLLDRLNDYVGKQIKTLSTVLGKKNRVAASKDVGEVHDEVAKEIHKKAKLLLTPRARAMAKDKSSQPPSSGNGSGNRSDSARDKPTPPKPPSGKADTVKFETAAMSEGGVIFEARQKGPTVIVVLNSDHPFYKRFFLDAATDKRMVAAADYLLYSMACAELRYSDGEDISIMLSNIKSEMSNNMKTLLK